MFDCIWLVGCQKPQSRWTALCPARPQPATNCIHGAFLLPPHAVGQPQTITLKCHLHHALRVVYTVYTEPQPRYLHRFSPMPKMVVFQPFTPVYTDLHQYLHRFACLFTPVYTSLHWFTLGVNNEVVVRLHRFTPFKAYPQSETRRIAGYTSNDNWQN